MPLAILAASTTITHAATSDGKTFGVSAGWLHIMPQGEKQGVYGKNNLTGTNVSDPHAGFEIDDSDTGAVLFDYFVNDNVSLELVAGVPPKMEISGKGTILGGAVDLSKVGKVGEVDAYTPVVLGKYQFGTAESRFRPFVGAGIMYAHFDDFKLDSSVNPALNSALGAGKLGLTATNVEIDDAVAPVATLGADYNFNKDWFATASVTYAHLKTKATLDINSSTLQKNAVKGETDIEINPIVTYLGVGYRF